MSGKDKMKRNNVTNVCGISLILLELLQLLRQTYGSLEDYTHLYCKYSTCPQSVFRSVRQFVLVHWLKLHKFKLGEKKKNPELRKFEGWAVFQRVRHLGYTALPSGLFPISSVHLWSDLTAPLYRQINMDISNCKDWMPCCFCLEAAMHFTFWLFLKNTVVNYIIRTIIQQIINLFQGNTIIKWDQDVKWGRKIRQMYLGVFCLNKV